MFLYRRRSYAEVSLNISNPTSSRRVVMRANAILRAAFLLSAALCLSLYFGAGRALAQDVGADVGGGAFRAKNPETQKKNTPKPTNTPKPGVKPTPGPSRAVAERVEDLLDN